MDLNWCAASCTLIDALSQRLVPDALWEIAEPLLPDFRARPQGREGACRTR